MLLKNYFKFKLEINNCRKIENVLCVFQSILLFQEDTNNENLITNRKNFSIVDKDEINIINLYVENNGNLLNERIDYLLDEEYQIKDLNLVVSENNKNLNYEILECYQIEELEYDSEDEFVKEFLSKKYLTSTVCILGPKPPQLYGYNMNSQEYNNLKDKLKENIRIAIANGKDIFLTNGYIGGEMLAFECVEELKKEFPHITNVLAIPFLKLDDKWVPDSKRKFEEMKLKADYLIEIDKTEHYKYGQPEIYTKEKMVKKNDFNIDFANYFIILKDKDFVLKPFFNKVNYYGKNSILIDV